MPDNEIKSSMRTCYVEIFPGEMRPAIVDLSPMMEVPRGWMVCRINVPKKHRGKGHGSALLRRICDDADLDQVRLYLCINPTGPLNYEQLQNWYGRHGFVPDQKTGWFFRPPQIMEMRVTVSPGIWTRSPFNDLCQVLFTGATNAEVTFTRGGPLMVHTTGRWQLKWGEL